MDLIIIKTVEIFAATTTTTTVIIIINSGTYGLSYIPFIYSKIDRFILLHIFRLFLTSVNYSNIIVFKSISLSGIDTNKNST